ncbi:MAG: DNA-binding protein [Chloroflexota bacterium]|nr:MAG: DNA-binding protein [Chloroflexota bacterium]
MRAITKHDRLTEIERLLFNNPEGLRAVEIAAVCAVDRRTIYRDLAALSDMGVPIYQRDGRFLLHQEYYMAPLRLNLDEALALFLAVRGWMHQAKQQNPHVIAALAKVSTALPEPLAAHTQSMAEMMRSRSIDRAFVSVLEAFTRAWSEQRRVRFWYKRADSSAVQVIEFATYFIETAVEGALCVVGYDYAHQRTGSFWLQQVKRVQFLPVTYEIPPRFECRRYFSSVPGTLISDSAETPVEVVVGFTAAAAPAVRAHEHTLPANCRLVSLDDGRSLLTMRVSDWRLLLPWLRSWGAQAEVLEPRALRDEIAREARRVAAVYASAAHT